MVVQAAERAGSLRVKLGSLKALHETGAEVDVDASVEGDAKLHGALTEHPKALLVSSWSRRLWKRMVWSPATMRSKRSVKMRPAPWGRSRSVG